MTSKKLLVLTPLAAALAAAAVSAQALGAPAAAISAPKALPENMAFGLRDLVEAYQAPTQNAATAEARATTPHASFRAKAADMKRARVDDADRVLVDVYLDGSVTIDQAVKDYQALGATVVARLDWYHQGALSLWVPVSQASTLAAKRGVGSVQLSVKPRHHIGVATSQGAVVLKTEGLNASGYLGAGITVGAISDSFDKLKTTGTGTSNAPLFPNVKYAQDQVSGDLPGPNNPNGYTTPVNVIKDYTSSTGVEDEGRAMLQIVHDLVPAAHLAFYTADVSEVDFAAGIVALQAAGCQVIVDDVGYYDEPMFSDGPVAKAVDKVNALGANYFSSAGNDDSSGYTATYNPVANSATSQATLLAQGVNYSGLTAAEKGAIVSFHSFGTNPDGTPILVQNIRIPGTNADATGVLAFQWDDPYNLTVGGVKQVTTDYDILVFSAAGAIQSSRSGQTNNISTNTPIELPGTALNPATSYKIVIAKTNRSSGVGAGVTPDLATHIRYTIETDDTPARGDFLTISNPETHGHPDAAGATGVAAYRYDVSPVADIHDPTHKIYPVVEQFSSNGPVVKYFDTNDQRLAVPITRKQPLLAAVNGTDTTFFPPVGVTGNTPPAAPGPGNPSPNDFDGNGWPNFFGTSAAAPHAAGVAALLLSAAQANGITLAPADVRNLLTSTTQGNSDQTPNYTSATAGPVVVGASGWARTDNNFFRVAYNGAAGSTLNTLTIDLSNVGIHFDQTTAIPTDTTTTATATGVVVSAFNGATAPPAGGLKPSVTSFTVTNGASGTSSVLTVNFANFLPGATLDFGIGRRNDGTNIFGQLADPIGGSPQIGTTGATISATTSASTYNGSFVNTFGKKWNYKTGYGLIDAQAALNLLLGH
ncbi:S8 family serine peptidase [Scleromatobacter humisilvae]|uniref:S8 family serine peptidase n=1 Tax=Scleromatobacter humisilvae TaxID=2897159 RepID=A0A9X1YSC2_9BURK|nr:S8 family serine peptidase [Scleromatobacter humisilvae]MCK9688221.1 S8 family serine peptidase [Scleromatobacter humisilvae]